MLKGLVSQSAYRIFLFPLFSAKALQLRTVRASFALTRFLFHVFDLTNAWSIKRHSEDMIQSERIEKGGETQTRAGPYELGEI